MEGCVDRISGLPESILHHILSLLVTKDVIQTAATCKILNQVWTTLPFFDLGPDFIPALPRSCPRIGFDDDEEDDDIYISDTDDNILAEIHRKRDELFTFVEQTLTRRRMQGLTIHKFRLDVKQLDVELSQYIDRWIHCLVQWCNIKELVLQVSCDSPCYDLPPVLFTAKSLRALTLKLCRVPMPCGSTITMPSLQKLHLESVYLDDQIMGHITNSCRNLEDLYLFACHGLRKIIVSGLSHLRVLKVIARSFPLEEVVVEEVVVEATNLERLSYTTANLPCKINIITNFVGSLKYLWLSGANITDTWFCELVSRLPSLEELGLANLNLNYIKISSSSLKRLRLVRLFDFKGWGTVGEVKIDAPNLVYLNYIGCLSIVFLNNLAIKEVYLRITGIHREEGNSEKLCIKWLQFLSKFDNSEVVNLDCLFYEKIIFPAKLNFLAPLAHIKHLTVRGRFQTSPLSIGELVHTLLRISPNLETLSLEDNDRDDDAYPVELVIKFYPEGIMGSRDCINFHWKCQRHCITHMNVDLKGHGDDAEVYGRLKNYFVHNTGLLEVNNVHYCHV